MNLGPGTRLVGNGASLVPVLQAWNVPVRLRSVLFDLDRSHGLSMAQGKFGL